MVKMARLYGSSFVVLCLLIESTLQSARHGFGAELLHASPDSQRNMPEYIMPSMFAESLAMHRMKRSIKPLPSSALPSDGSNPSTQSSNNNNNNNNGSPSTTATAAADKSMKNFVNSSPQNASNSNNLMQNTNNKNITTMVSFCNNNNFSYISCTSSVCFSEPHFIIFSLWVLFVYVISFFFHHIFYYFCHIA